MDAYLILHHCITDIFNQTAKFIRILDIAEETLNPPLLCQRLEFLENISQFSNDPCSSGSTQNFGKCGRTVPVSFSVPARWRHPGEQVRRAIL